MRVGGHLVLESVQNLINLADGGGRRERERFLLQALAVLVEAEDHAPVGRVGFSLVVAADEEEDE